MKKILILFLLLTYTFISAQKKTRADRYFEKGDYINAAINYEKELSRYSHTKHITQNIADCYYNTYKFRNARYYLKKLISGRFNDKNKTYDNIYNFKMYHVLSTLGNHVNATDYLAKYKKGLGETINIKETIEAIETFKLQTAKYRIKKSTFNSEASDFGAVKQGDSLYFVSDRTKSILQKNYKWTHRPYLDIYKTTIKNNRIISSDIEKLPKEINSKLHEGNFCFADNGNVLYVSRSNISKKEEIFDDKKTNNIQLFKAEKINGKWSALEKLPFCENGYSYEHPTVSKDGKKLYFSSNVKGGYGSFDIYSVDIIGTHESYNNVKNLGAIINTPNREQFPFISETGNLFFASDGHLGVGMLDNFVSENVNGKFTKPINLGTPINSKYDDFNIIYSDKTNGYFASNRKTLNDDIYSFSQIKEIFEREYINVFEIRDADTKQYISDVKVILKNKKGKEIYNNTLSEKASFTMNLLSSSYSFSAEADTTYFKNTKLVKTLEKKNQKHILYLKKKPKIASENKVVKENKRPTAIVKEIKEKTISEAENKKRERKKALLLDEREPKIYLDTNNKLYFKVPPIYFEFDKWTLTKESKKALDELAKKLEQFPKIHIKINAHTDNIGTETYNQILSEKRAEATRNYLALEGYINARRLKFEGFGESKPLINCKESCTDEERKLNRRSEFEIIEY